MSRSVTIHGCNPEQLSRINGRVSLLVTDGDGDAHVHFLVIAPFGVEYEEAMATVSQVVDRFKTSDEYSDNWTYDDVAATLRALQFQIFNVPVWQE